MPKIDIRNFDSLDEDDFVSAFETLSLNKRTLKLKSKDNPHRDDAIKLARQQKRELTESFLMEEAYHD